ncbi:MAG: GNAT family N-acetyltransferase [Bauldia sp.]
MAAGDDDTPPFVTRLARPADRPVLIDITRRASLFRPSNYAAALIAHPEVIDVAAEDIAAGHVVVATLFEVVLGYASVLPREAGHAELDAIFVEPAEWRQGIGRMLMDASEVTARRLGADMLDVIANPQAEAFYRACGFVVTGTAGTRFAPALSMSKTLRSDGRS